MNETEAFLAEGERWLDDASFQLEIAQVAAPVREELIERARSLIAETGESPTKLFGWPREWAEEQIAERRSQGLPAAVPDPSASWRDVPVLGMYLASAFAVVFLLVALVEEGWGLDYDLRLLGFPVAGGVMVMTALTVWEKTLSRRPFGAAAAAGAGILICGSLLVGLLVTWISEHPGPQAGAWHLGLLVLACALAGKVLDTLLPEKKPPAWRTPRDDEEWLGVLAGVLRLRADMPEQRVRTIVAEAQGHAVEAGSTLQEEFGRPEDYAAQFPTDQTNRTRRAAWGYSAMAALWTFLALPPDGSWRQGILALLWACLAAWEWRQVRRAAAPPAAG
ncbi:hypothetical protein [Nocardioides sp. 616]|uniref:hypothetical protein n=1 Tax=Nocardioides sp. 616 TaxID=2268090 RepID=UPI000CE43630|nr:hypothetical protein [Nocardioides sp. 616]